MQTFARKIGSFQLLIFVVFGALLGFSISIIGRLPNQMLLVAVFAISFPFLAFIIGDVRRFLLAASAAILPVTIDVNFMNVFENQAGAHTIGISLQDIFVILLIFLWLVEAASKEGVAFHFYPRLTIPAILYIEACLLTLLWAPRLDLAAMEIVRMVKVFILYFVIANQIRDRNDLKLVAWALIASLVFEGSVAVLQMIKGGTIGLAFLGEAYLPDIDRSKLWRVMGTLGHPNRLAMYLEMLLPLCFGMFLLEKRMRRKMMALSSFGLGLVALIMTGSRGAWIAFVLGMLVFFILAVKSRHVKLSALFGTGIIGLIVMAGVALGFSGMIEERIYGDDYGSAMSRIPMIQIAINLIEAHPLGGVGINNYAVVMKKYNDTILGRRFKSIPRPVHNMFLLVTGETGIIGLSMLLLLLYFFFATAFKSARSPDETISIINISVLAGIVAMCAHGMVDKHPPGGYPLFYVLMALIASAYFLNKHLSDNDLSQPVNADDKEIGRSKSIPGT